DHARIGLQLRLRKLPLEELRRAAQPAERVLHLVGELPDDPPRQPLLREQGGLAAHLPIALRVEQLEQQAGLALERRRTTVEDQLALADAGRELAQPEREPGLERAPAKREQLARRRHELRDRPADHAPRARPEQRLGRGIQKGDVELAVEHDDRGGQALESVAAGGRAACSAERAAARRASAQPAFGTRRGGAFGLFGFRMLVCCTMKVTGNERSTISPRASRIAACSVCTPRNTSGTVTWSDVVFRYRRSPSIKMSIT